MLEINRKPCKNIEEEKKRNHYTLQDLITHNSSSATPHYSPANSGIPELQTHKNVDQQRPNTMKSNSVGNSTSKRALFLTEGSQVRLSCKD
ncbi:uncharacterized protein [Rutidosis leptorrhynchoides]|uniref:uncharacterized protein isoform X2 n=1 Tax=Rutidosis leptorrhynchoides TaxID=125765 RepID=UPI003A999F5F